MSTSMNPLRNLLYGQFYFIIRRQSERFDTLAYLFLPVEFADLNADVSKVFFQHREKEVTRVSLSAKRACFIIRDAPSMLKRIGDFNAGNSRAIISAF